MCLLNFQNWLDTESFTRFRPLPWLILYSAPLLDGAYTGGLAQDHPCTYYTACHYIQPFHSPRVEDHLAALVPPTPHLPPDCTQTDQFLPLSWDSSSAHLAPFSCQLCHHSHLLPHFLYASVHIQPKRDHITSMPEPPQSSTCVSILAVALETIGQILAATSVEAWL